MLNDLYSHFKFCKLDLTATSKSSLRMATSARVKDFLIQLLRSQSLAIKFLIRFPTPLQQRPKHFLAYVQIAILTFKATFGNFTLSPE